MQSNLWKSSFQSEDKNRVQLLLVLSRVKTKSRGAADSDEFMPRFFLVLNSSGLNIE